MAIDVLSIFCKYEFWMIFRFTNSRRLARLRKNFFSPNQKGTVARQAAVPFTASYFEPPSVSEFSAEMRWAKKIGRNVIKITMVATTLVTGRSRGRTN